MSTKENIDFIKQELTSEEKLLESVIKVEKFYKKYKKILIGIGLLLVLLGIGSGVYEWNKERELKKSNELYLQLLTEPNNQQKLQELKSLNPKLYTLLLYQKGIKEKDISLLQQVVALQDPILSDLALYHIAILKKNQKDIDDYLKNQQIMKNVTLLEYGYLLDAQDKVKEARSKLMLIDKESEVKPFAILLSHYGVTK